MILIAFDGFWATFWSFWEHKMGSRRFWSDSGTFSMISGRFGTFWLHFAWFWSLLTDFEQHFDHFGSTKWDPDRFWGGFGAILVLFRWFQVVLRLFGFVLHDFDRFWRILSNILIILGAQNGILKSYGGHPRSRVSQRLGCEIWFRPKTVANAFVRRGETPGLNPVEVTSVQSLKQRNRSLNYIVSQFFQDLQAFKLVFMTKAGAISQSWGIAA
jgi:hypothetical protein